MYAVSNICIAIDRFITILRPCCAINVCFCFFPQTVRPLFNNKTQPVPQEAMQVETDFFTQQAKLQADARQALAEAKETARRQMEIERERMTTSPITDMLRASLTKVCFNYSYDKNIECVYNYLHSISYPISSLLRRENLSYMH